MHQEQKVRVTEWFVLKSGKAGLQKYLIRFVDVDTGHAEEHVLRHTDSVVVVTPVCVHPNLVQ